jgi:NAD-dependent SIR2 family protein deacetylase
VRKSITKCNESETTFPYQLKMYMHVCVGAGMSADSNVSTFRPCDHEKPSDQQKSTSSHINFSTSVNSTPTSSGSMMRSISLEQACYQKFPEKAWCYDAGYRETIHRSSPHEGYTLLLDLLRRKDRPFFVMTTNIDRYFAQAGFPESQLYETHGSVDTLQCAKVGTKRCPGVWPWPQETPLPTFNRVDATVDLNTGDRIVHLL